MIGKRNANKKVGFDFGLPLKNFKTYKAASQIPILNFNLTYNLNLTQSSGGSSVRGGM